MSENKTARNTSKNRQTVSGNTRRNTTPPSAGSEGGWGGARPKVVKPTVSPTNQPSPYANLFKPYVYGASHK